MAKYVQNVRNVHLALGREMKNRVKGFFRGMVRSGLALQRKSQELVPLEYGPLRASAFTRREIEDSKITVIVGYTKEYAIYQHEILEYRHLPGRIAKYLEHPARFMRDTFVELVMIESKRVPKPRPKGRKK